MQKLDADGYIDNALMVMITRILILHGQIEDNQSGAKLVCFDANGVSSFQGYKNIVSKQLLNN